MTNRNTKEIVKSEPEHKCLNCGNELIGNFCHNCGQENIQERVTLKLIFQDVMEDYFALNSKLIISFLPLLLKPGYLTKEYLLGKRTKYMKPFKMYLALSIFFFFIFFLNIKPDQDDKLNITSSPDTSNIHIGAKYKVIGDTATIGDALKDSDVSFSFSSSDSTDSTKSNWAEKMLEDKLKEVEDLTGEEIKKRISRNFKNNVPKMMFILLPIFALILKLFYIRQDAYYVDHFVFALHLHSFIYMIMLLSMLLGFIFPRTGLMNFILFTTVVFYTILALKSVYEQKIGKTIVKYFLLTTAYSIIFFISLILLTIVSFWLM